VSTPRSMIAMWISLSLFVAWAVLTFPAVNVLPLWSGVFIVGAAVGLKVFLR
jgi:hypothetical protein